ncbi:TonB-dependent receptor [uncultured Maribacter sp.]|uniref:TonB-dependent receptor domain-containing protein n=1 Tax=uncultured Maribacter sp. TaxID=431308 RepID=UPI002639E636|nr:TonB-dependent receptor [uncultured Maribacter sp.]
MKLILFITLLIACSFQLAGQSSSIKGQLLDESKQAIVFANVALYKTKDSSIVKGVISDENGIFKLKDVAQGSYYLIASYLGFSDSKKENIQISAQEHIDLGILTFKNAAITLQETIVIGNRPMVETKPDRTIFNVEKTINSVGADAINLLRKAPGITIDNNNNINVLGRSGVLVYINGKRLPLKGQDLSNYLQNLTSEQIDRIEIITNPGAQYEAEGNAGIIDIRIKKDKKLGANATVNSGFSPGRYPQSNLSINGNYRNKKINAFGSFGGFNRESFGNEYFNSFQNSLNLKEANQQSSENKGYDYRLGSDIHLSEKHSLGFLVNGQISNNDENILNTIEIYNATTNELDSTLIADSHTKEKMQQQSYSISYGFNNKKGRSLNLDLDYGRYKNESIRFLPNKYYNQNGELLSELINQFDTPTDIEIYTLTLDTKDSIFEGQISVGTKLNLVNSDNSFLFFDEIDGVFTQNNRQSNQFNYKENVYAGYLNFARPLGSQLNVSLGLRTEKTEAKGVLQVFSQDLEEPTVDLNYLDWFPSMGLTWQANSQNLIAFNFGRRINRPDYKVLNPFNFQLSQLSFLKGNPSLRPEVVNNIEIGYTYNYKYNLKLAYSETKNRIVQFIGPDDIDPRIKVYSWQNLGKQKVFNINFNTHITINNWWDTYFNLNGGHSRNQADYDDGVTVDIESFSYNIYYQNTLKLPYEISGEISGYFNGPGIWEGVFLYEPTYSLNLGLQRKFLKERMNVKLSVSDIFYQSGWSGFSDFNGLYSRGNGNWDSRRASLSISYKLGNQNTKSNG